METASLVLTLGESLMAPLLPLVIIPRIHQASRHLSINQTSRERERDQWPPDCELKHRDVNLSSSSGAKLFLAAATNAILM